MGISEKIGKDLMDKFFGFSGATSADDSVVFEERIKDVRNTCKQHNTDKFVAYLDKCLIPSLTENIMKPRTVRGVQDEWTNHNTESANHVLKCAVEWKQQPLMDLVDKLYKAVCVQEKELRRAITNTGSFILADAYGKFFIPPHQWAGMTIFEKDAAFETLICGRSRKTCTSTDGKKVVTKPTGSRKPGQRRRGKAERSRTPTRKRPNCSPAPSKESDF